MLKFLAFFLLFLVLNIGSSKGINVASFGPTQAPATAPFVPNSPPTEAPTAAPPTARFAPTQAPATAPPLHPPLPPPPPPPQPLPPQEEVHAVNALLKLAWAPGVVLRPTFNATDCQTYKVPGIWCNCKRWNNTCRVTYINLGGWNLRGQVPEQIGDLINLTSLDLSSNKLRGSIPESVAKLSQLSVLRLNKNNFQGPIPRFLAEMKSLQTLDLSDNSFNGSIPHELGNLTSLQYLYLGNNLLNESIPLDLGNISSLKLLDLHDNELSGQLPEQLGNLANLVDLDLSNNNLTGAFPPSFRKLQMLQNFNIRGNSFKGTIPEFISNCIYLGKLILSGNNFSGPPLPTAITALTRLTYLFITDIAGGGTNFLIPEVKSNVAWETLILRNCSLTGPIPAFIWNLQSLSLLDLSFNNLFGGIPADVKPPSLKSIFLRKNKLNGTLPEWLTNLTVSLVDVSENFFTNVTVPTANISSNLNLFACCNTSNQHLIKWQEANYFCDNDALTYDHLYINCGGNATFINGSNYEADMQREGASTFFLSHNKAWAYSSMGTFLDSNQKDYILNETCNLTMADAPLYKDARVSPISLKYYGFCLKKGNYTLKLHFAEIPWDERKAASIKRRRVFDVDIQGGQYYLKDFNIEEEAKGVDKEKTKEFNVSVNRRLEVHFYWSGKGSTPTRYYGPLISAISLSPVLKEHKKLPPSTIGVIAGSATLFVGLMLALFWKLGWLHNKTSKDEEFRSFELFPGEVYTFEEIESATKNFHPDYKIGEGRNGAVYKVNIRDDTQLAVKCISRKSKQGAQKFMKEILTTFTLNHPNLVSLKGWCVKQNEFLLIHEYMETGSLGNVLSGPPEVKSNLNWLKRVQICRDVAKGLVFLHEKRQIIHSDIKPTNILLDKDFNAKISDFGYAESNAEENTLKIEKIAGTSDYRAPEHVRGTLTPKADVYSFGLLMLEIFSGRSISISRGKESVFLWDSANIYKNGNNLIALLDDDLRSGFTTDEVLKILELAMKCANPTADLRPTMLDVAKELEEVGKVEESKGTMTNESPINVPSPVKITSSQSTQSGSTSQEAISSSIRKESDGSITSAG